jgi:soluble lytic murein transglycosylase-like protein
MKRLLLSLAIALGMSALSASADTSRGDPSSFSARAGHYDAKTGRPLAKAEKRRGRTAAEGTRKARTKHVTKTRRRGEAGTRRANARPAGKVRAAKAGPYSARRTRLLPAVRAATPSHIPVDLVDAIISKESRYDVNARGSSGEIGLMQIMPSTARQIARKIGQGSIAGLSDAQLRRYLSNPTINLKFGLSYLSTCHKMAKGNIAATVGCYNAGPANMWRWGKIKITRAYVNFVRLHMANES